MQFVQKVTFEPLMDLKKKKKSIMEIGNVTKAATFKLLKVFFT